jgi:hypothetical protein
MPSSCRYDVASEAGKGEGACADSAAASLWDSVGKDVIEKTSNGWTTVLTTARAGLA